METAVWAFQPLPELNNQTGFVAVEESLALVLIASGRVQDPRIGATALKYITTEAPPVVTPQNPDTCNEYETKVMTPKQRKK